MSEEPKQETQAPTHDDDGFPIGKRSDILDALIAARKAGASFKETETAAAKEHGYTGTWTALRKAIENAHGGKFPEVVKAPKEPKKTAPKPAKQGKSRVSKRSVKAKKAVKGKAAKKRAHKQRKKREGLSCLEAAVKVLKESKTPLNAVSITAKAIEKGYWKSDSATPSQTISGAIQREIKDKKKESRFKKVDRGLYVAA